MKNIMNLNGTTVALMLSGMLFQQHISLAQNAMEKEHIRLLKDSSMQLNTKTYYRELRNAGIPDKEAKDRMNNLITELNYINSANGKSASMQMVPFAPLQVTSFNYCWQTMSGSNIAWPGERTTSACSCSGFLPVGTAPSCATGNIGFEQGNFTGWSGRIGDFYSTGWSSCGANNAYYVFDPTPVFQGAVHPEPARHLIVEKGMTDPLAGFPMVEIPQDPGVANNYAIRLGNERNGAKVDQLIYKLKADATHHFLNYKYAVVLQDPGNHPECMRPSFNVELYKISECDASAERIECGSFRVTYAGNIPGFSYVRDIAYKPWTNVMVDLSQYMTSSEEEFYIKFTTTDCAWGGHYGYAYIDGVCTDIGLTYVGTECYGSPIQFVAPAMTGSGATYSWEVDDLPISGANGSVLTRTFTSVSNHDIEVKIIYQNGLAGVCTTEFNTSVVLEPCNVMQSNCAEDCVASFAPESGKKYVLSAWVKQDQTSFVENYANAKVKLKFTIPDCSTCPSTATCSSAACTSCPTCPFPSCSTSSCVLTFTATGKIIDGWQRIEQEFIVPEGAVEMFVELVNDGAAASFFDDIRIYPFDGSMKSYVYDPISQKLLAELDENNYATFYEYDQEGNLVRVKKETERGVKTIKESMNNTSVKPAN